jgi:hypothetical protein
MGLSVDQGPALGAALIRAGKSAGRSYLPSGVEARRGVTIAADLLVDDRRLEMILARMS